MADMAFDTLKYMRLAKRKNENPLSPYFRHNWDLHTTCAIDNKPRALHRVITERITKVRHLGAGYFYAVHTTRRVFPVVFTSRYILKMKGLCAAVPSDYFMCDKGRSINFFGKVYSLRDLGYTFSNGKCHGTGTIFTEFGKWNFYPEDIVEISWVEKNRYALLFADGFYGEVVYSDDFVKRLDGLVPEFAHALNTGEGIRLTAEGEVVVGGSDEDAVSDGMHEREHFMHDKTTVVHVV